MKRLFIITLITFGLLSGCVSTSEMNSLKSTVANLQYESLSHKKDIETQKKRQDESISEINKLRERFESIYALRESQSNLLSQTSDFSKELQNIKGRFDENKYFLDKTLKEIASERELQQAKIAALEKEIKELKELRSKITEKQEDAPKKTDTPEEDASQKDAQSLYDDAQIDFKDKKSAQARQKFEKFIKENPNHTLASNSQFWIGETYYSEKKYEDAILAYETFIKKYPKHEKIKSAMLKQGYSFIELGDRKTGKLILERLIERYPRTTEAELSEKKIAELLAQNKKSASTKQKTKKR